MSFAFVREEKRRLLRLGLLESSLERIELDVKNRTPTDLRLGWPIIY